MINIICSLHRVEFYTKDIIKSRKQELWISQVLVLFLVYLALCW